MARKECWRVEVGSNLGLVSKCMPKDEATKLAKRIDHGGMRVFIVHTTGKEVSHGEEIKGDF